MAGSGSDYREIMHKHRDDDATLASDNSLNDDSDCVIAVKSGEHYMIRGYVHASFGAGGIQVGLNGPAFSALHYGIIGYESAALASFGAVIATAWDTVMAVAGGGGGGTFAIIHGYVILTADGNIVLRWCQNSSNVANTIMHAGTSLELIRME